MMPILYYAEAAAKEIVHVYSWLPFVGKGVVVLHLGIMSSIIGYFAINRVWKYCHWI